MLIKNKTPYAMERSIIFDRHGNETLLVILKGTYEFWQGGADLSEQQAGINLADEYFADPGTSSIKVATDFLPTRPSTGITLCGHAVATNGQADSTSEFMFGVQMGYEIKNGKLGKAISDTTISGVAFDMLNNVSMVSDEMVWSCAGMCGKKQPMPVGMGGPAVKTKVYIGGQ